MNWIHALIFGVVEGLTEFLPVSSTGHLMLTARLLGLPQTDFMKTFEISIQLGAIFAVLAVYGHTLWKKKNVFLKVIAAFIPTMIIGALLYPMIKKRFLNNDALVLWSLFIGGLILILFDLWQKNRQSRIHDMQDIPFKEAVFIGLAQCASMVPGVSRSASTIIGGSLIGLSRTVVVEFSFLLAIPTIAAATALDLFKSRELFVRADWSLLGIGMVSSFIVALLAVKLFLRYVQKHSFAIFGIYRIAVAAVFWLWVK